MTLFLSGLHDADEIVAAVAQAVPLSFHYLDVPNDDATVSEIREAVARAGDAMTHFILAVGAGRGSDIAAADWQCEVTTPLRRAFGLVTGAARMFRAAGRGKIAIVLPSSGLLPGYPPSAGSVLFRAILGMNEALRAELAPTAVRVSIVFYDIDDLQPDDLSLRLAERLDDGAMYSLSPLVTRERINCYFARMLAEVARASAGAPLPDIGPMAAVYDLGSIRAPIAISRSKSDD